MRWTARQERATTAWFVYSATCGSAPSWRGLREWPTSAAWETTWKRPPASSSKERGPVEHPGPGERDLPEGPHRDGVGWNPSRLHGGGRRAAHADLLRERLDVQRRVLGRDRSAPRRARPPRRVR